MRLLKHPGIYFLFLFLFITSFGFGQGTVLSGWVKDKDTGEALPFVSIVFTGTTTGIQTDFEGNYLLETENLNNKTITVAYLGYLNQDISIQVGKTQEINILLEPNSEILDEVVVKADRKMEKDTAAITLFRKVVRNKPNNRSDNLDYYSYEEYIKTEFDIFNLSDKFKERKILKPFDFVLENVDTSDSGKEYLPFLLKERLSDVYYSNYQGATKTIVKADKFSGIDNVSVAELVEFSFDEVDVYDNLFRISGKSFISPFANGALATYNYFLADSSFVDDLWCYKLEFTGKRKQDLAFSGYAWIHDGTFAIKSIDLYILPAVNINFINSFALRQTFTYYQDRHWFKESEYVHSALNLSKDEDKQSFMVRKDISRKNITINVPIPDKVFRGDAVEILTDARDKKLEYWDQVRHVKLSKKERKIYSTIDSVKSTRAYKNMEWLAYFGTTAFLRSGPVEFGRFFTFFSWNEVEGKRYRFGGRTNSKFSKKIQLDAYLAYGSRDSAWKYDLGYRMHLNRRNNRWHMLGAGYRFDLIQLDVVDPLYTHDNLLLSILRSRPLGDLLKVRRAEAYYEREWLKGLTTNVSFKHTSFFSVPTGFTFSYTDTISQNVVEVPKFTTTEFGLHILWGKQQKFFETNFVRFPITFHQPVFYLDYMAGIKGFLGGEFDYHKVEIGVEQRLSNPFGYTKYQGFAGKIFGLAPYPLLKLHKGNQTFILNKESFNMMNEFEYVSDEYLGVWVEHHFEGLIMNQIPLIKKLKWRSFVTFRGLVGDLDKEKALLIDLPERLGGLNGVYMESGFGIENIFKVIRVDFIWRITQQNLDSSARFGFRIGFQPAI